MGDAHRHRGAVDQDDHVASVELVGLAEREAQGHVGHSRHRRLADQARHIEWAHLTPLFVPQKGDERIQTPPVPHPRSSWPAL